MADSEEKQTQAGIQIIVCTVSPRVPVLYWRSLCLMRLTCFIADVVDQSLNLTSVEEISKSRHISFPARIVCARSAVDFSRTSLLYRFFT
jgi:hypothetical protein